MRHTRHHRPPFLDAAAIRRGAGRRISYVDSSCEFVASKDTTLNGFPVPTGEPFDKSQVTERRLRQLYEARFIALAPGTSPVMPATTKLAVGPTDLVNPGKAEPAPKKRGVKRRAQAVAPAG